MNGGTHTHVQTDNPKQWALGVGIKNIPIGQLTDSTLAAVVPSAST